MLAEGAADFIARLVTGEESDPVRSEWAGPREAELWQRFTADIDLTRDLKESDSDQRGTPRQKAIARWVHNYGSAPDGWPSELGYWIGLRIWERYYDAAPDKRAALQAMLEVCDPRYILEVGRFHSE